MLSVHQLSIIFLQALEKLCAILPVDSIEQKTVLQELHVIIMSLIIRAGQRSKLYSAGFCTHLMSASHLL